MSSFFIQLRSSTNDIKLGLKLLINVDGATFDNSWGVVAVVRDW